MEAKPILNIKKILFWWHRRLKNDLSIILYASFSFDSFFPFFLNLEFASFFIMMIPTPSNIYKFYAWFYCSAPYPGEISHLSTDRMSKRWHPVEFLRHLKIGHKQLTIQRQGFLIRKQYQTFFFSMQRFKLKRQPHKMVKHTQTIRVVSVLVWPFCRVGA